MKLSCKHLNPFIVLLTMFCLWGMAFIWRSSYIIHGKLFFCLVDDAMVSMRYAHNLASGIGPFWNPGETVEGYTNPLWMLLMAGVHCLPLSENFTSLAMQLMGLGILVINLFGAKRLGASLSTQENHSTAVGNLATLFTACLYPLNYWTLMGMEVGLVACLCTWATVLAMEDVKADRVSLRPWLLLAVGTFVRLDVAVLWGALGFACALCSTAKRWRVLLIGIVLGTAVLGLQTACRWAIYGDVLPNTYYLKMTGFPALLRVTRGMLYTGLSLCCLPIGALAFLLCSKLTGFKNTLAQSYAIIPLAVVVAATFYSAYIGGDAWERVIDLNRFLAPVSPLLASMVALFAVTLYRHAMTKPLWIATFAMLFCIWRSTSPSDLLLVRPPLDRADNIRNTQLALTLRDSISTTASVAVEYAGTIPYFMSHHWMIDLLGKSDRHVAQTPMHRGFLPVSPWREFYPGHLKWDYAYSIGTLQPDIMCAIWKKNEPFVRPYLENYRREEMYGVDVYLKK